MLEDTQKIREMAGGNNKMRQKEKPKKISPEDKKRITSSFYLMVPTLLISMLGILSGDIKDMFIIVCMAIYQWIMINKFIEDYYNRKI